VCKADKGVTFSRVSRVVTNQGEEPQKLLELRRKLWICAVNTGFAQEDFSSHRSVSSILAKDFHLNFSFHSISSAYIESLLGKIKCKKSCGPDNITPKILKLSTSALAVPLTNHLNHCIATSR